MNKKQIQFEYEILGKDVQAITKTHNISPQILDYLIKERGWRRLPVADKLSTWSHAENPSEDLMSQVSEQANLCNVLQASELTPALIGLKRAIIASCEDMLSACQEPAALKTLAEIIKIIEPPVAKEQGADEGLKIMVVNQFGEQGTEIAGSMTNANGHTQVAIDVGGKDDGRCERFN